MYEDAKKYVKLTTATKELYWATRTGWNLNTIATLNKKPAGFDTLVFIQKGDEILGVFTP